MYVVDTTPIYSNLHLFNQEQHIAELSERPISFQKIKDYALKIIGGETLWWKTAQNVRMEWKMIAFS